MRTRTVRMSLLIFLVSLPRPVSGTGSDFIEEVRGLAQGRPDAPGRAPHRGRRSRRNSLLARRADLLVVIQPGCEACRQRDRYPGLPSRLHFRNCTSCSSRRRSTSGKWIAPFPVYIDRDGNFLKQVRKLITPAIYWMDASGKIRYARAGQQSEDEEKRLFRTLLEETRESNALNESRHRTP